MKDILYIGIFRTNPKPVVQLCCEEDLSDFRWYKGTLREFMVEFSKIFAERTKPDDGPVDIPKEVQGEQYIFHVSARTEGVSGVLVSRASYTPLVAHSVLRKILDQFLTKYPIKSLSGADLPGRSFPFPELTEYIIKYQDPTQADSIVKIQTELGETKKILHKTIEQVLERGEKIDSLVQKSDTLSAQSKMFYTQAKKQNSCCSIM